MGGSPFKYGWSCRCALIREENQYGAEAGGNQVRGYPAEEAVAKICMARKGRFVRSTGCDYTKLVTGIVHAAV